MAKDKVIVIRGTVDWCKLLGAARPHTGNPKYDKGPYWSIDITPNAESLATLNQLGLSGKLREPNADNPKEHRKENYLSLRVLENRPDGKKNPPPVVKNVRGEDWGDTDIGNGTVADIKVRVVDYGKGVQQGVYFQAMRVLELVPYEREAFAPLSPDDEYFREPEQMASEPEVEPAEFDDDDVPA